MKRREEEKTEDLNAPSLLAPSGSGGVGVHSSSNLMGLNQNDQLNGLMGPNSAMDRKFI